MKRLSVHEVKTNFSSLVNSVAADGEVIVIMRYGKAVAQLTPLPGLARNVKPDARLSRIKIKYNPLEPTEGEWENG